jgi:hypothetical protein
MKKKMALSVPLKGYALAQTTKNVTTLKQILAYQLPIKSKKTDTVGVLILNNQVTL